MEQLAASAHLLQGFEVAAFVVDTGDTVAHELFGDVGDPIAVTLRSFSFREGAALPHAGECIAGAVGNTAVELAVGVAVEGAARRIGRVLVDVGHLQRFAVVEGRVAAAMLDDHGVFFRDLVEVVDVDKPWPKRRLGLE